MGYTTSDLMARLTTPYATGEKDVVEIHTGQASKTIYPVKEPHFSIVRSLTGTWTPGCDALTNPSFETFAGGTDARLKVWHKFDAADGGVVADASGNGYTASISTYGSLYVQDVNADGADVVIGNGGGTTRVSQSFTVLRDANTQQAANNLTIRLRKIGSPTGNATLRVGTTRDASGTVIEQTFDVSTLSTSFADKNFTLDALSIAANAAYYVTVEYSGGDGSNHIAWAATSTGGQINGNKWIQDVSTAGDQRMILRMTRVAPYYVAGLIPGSTTAIDSDGDTMTLDYSGAAATFVKTLTTKTLSMVINRYAQSGSQGNVTYLFMTKEPGGNELGYSFTIDANNKLVLKHANGTTSESKVGTQTVPLNQVVRVGFTYDDVTKVVTFYVNGVADTPQTFTTITTGWADNTANRSRWFGDDGNGHNDGALNGLADDLRIYNAVLTPSEMALVHGTGENSITETATGWSNQGTVSYARSYEAPYSGTHAIRIAPGGASTAEGIAQSLTGFIVGQTYRVTVYGKGSGSTGVPRLKVHATGEESTPVVNVAGTTSSAWQELTGTFVPEAGKTYLLSLLKNGASGSTDHIYFDNVIYVGVTLTNYSFVEGTDFERYNASAMASYDSVRFLRGGPDVGTSFQITYSRKVNNDKMMAAFYNGFWATVKEGLDDIEVQSKLGTMTGGSLDKWAKLVNLVRYDGETDARFRLRVKAALRRLIGFNTVDDLIDFCAGLLDVDATEFTVTENVASDQPGVEKPGYVEVSFNLELLDAIVTPAEYVEITDLLTELASACGAAGVKVRMAPVGGALYDVDSYDVGVYAR